MGSDSDGASTLAVSPVPTEHCLLGSRVLSPALLAGPALALPGVRGEREGDRMGGDGSFSK